MDIQSYHPELFKDVVLPHVLCNDSQVRIGLVFCKNELHSLKYIFKIIKESLPRYTLPEPTFKVFLVFEFLQKSLSSILPTEKRMFSTMKEHVHQNPSTPYINRPQILLVIA